MSTRRKSTTLIKYLSEEEKERLKALVLRLIEIAKNMHKRKMEKEGDQL